MIEVEMAKLGPVERLEWQEYLTSKEVADRLRTSVETVRYWRYVGRGPKSFKVGRRVLYAQVDLQEWIDEARNRDSTRPEQETASVLRTPRRS